MSGLWLAMFGCVCDQQETVDPMSGVVSEAYDRLREELSVFEKSKAWYDVRVLLEKGSYDVPAFATIAEAADYCEKVGTGEIAQLEDGRITGFEILRRESKS